MGLATDPAQTFEVRLEADAEGVGPAWRFRYASVRQWRALNNVLRGRISAEAADKRISALSEIVERAKNESNAEKVERMIAYLDDLADAGDDDPVDLRLDELIGVLEALKAEGPNVEESCALSELYELAWDVLRRVRAEASDLGNSESPSHGSAEKCAAADVPGESVTGQAHLSPPLCGGPHPTKKSE